MTTDNDGGVAVEADAAGGPPIARDTDPDTPHEAAGTIEDSGRRQAGILAAFTSIFNRPGLLAREHGDLLAVEGWPEAWRRCSDAVALGLAYYQGKRVYAGTGRRAQMLWPVPGVTPANAWEKRGTAYRTPAGTPPAEPEESEDDWDPTIMLRWERAKRLIAEGRYNVVDVAVCPDCSGPTLLRTYLEGPLLELFEPFTPRIIEPCKKCMGEREQAQRSAGVRASGEAATAE
jgi:hypothetical protein